MSILIKHQLIRFVAKNLSSCYILLDHEKVVRWVGFIQGVLYRNNLISIDIERDITRPWFHQFYQDTLQNVPKSVDVMTK